MFKDLQAEVWFQNAPDIGPQAPITIGSQLIGHTGSPSVVNGRLRLPIVLTSSDAVPDATIFVVTHDPRGSRLVARPRGSPLHLSSTEPYQFRGASNEFEYVWMRAKDTFGDLIR